MKLQDNFVPVKEPEDTSPCSHCIHNRKLLRYFKCRKCDNFLKSTENYY